MYTCNVRAWLYLYVHSMLNQRNTISLCIPPVRTLLHIAVLHEENYILVTAQGPTAHNFLSLTIVFSDVSLMCALIKEKVHIIF